MTFTEDKIKEINEAANNGLVIGNSLDGAHVYNGNWGICKVEELGKMIDRLLAVKVAIEVRTGVKV